MTEAEHAETYEQRVQGIQLANQPILDGFEDWLKHSGLREPTMSQLSEIIMSGANRASQSLMASWVNVKPRAKNISAASRRLSL
jgi:hypothetical protein